MPKMIPSLLMFAGVVLLVVAFCGMMNDHNNRYPGPMIGISIVAILLALLMTPSHARDDGRYAQSPLKQWFDQLASGKGLCCSMADGYRVEDADWQSNGIGYRVRIPKSTNSQDLIWMDVPGDAVITEPNKAGRTMVWPLYGIEGPSIRCFIPGSMT